MKKNKVILTFIICLLPMIIGGLFYQYLPDKLPVHFGIDNNPNLYASRGVFIFLIPIAMALLQLFLVLTVFYTSKKLQKSPKLLKLTLWIVPVLSLLTSILIVVYVYNQSINVGRIVCLFVSIILIIIGNYSTKMDYESGKRFFRPTPKSVADFRKKNKITSMALILLGFLFFLVAWFIPFG
ncbi:MULTISPECIES: DUF1648 domain-containing protein [unclassified Enterococcus]|uniref:DUF1648 domain-containing protein n=1 Tax=unclassified Enterococcus TaxID=2608891 RepID=UPI00155671FD|nr:MULTISPECIES: DUF1648 domain-containing protein [unclassified Enterococcus]MBS7577790.1 DUF1648 domain-containing protein [Enterococcus sp. MMGLQ5-2]MBS7585050.1 DUF1648 domain-containing protein [Enterococcus sp. MMGLQ5-1]NPD12906.1 DUF1648 domain-containing protein [Enterococcus sp. MMGLQ5-1]NPD37620.1 DUF1648 domain-containing protein [Enterococcus sp. MMGLQ5-2]